MVDYIGTYEELGRMLLSTIDKMDVVERGITKKANDKLQLGGKSEGFAAKATLRLKALEIRANSIIKAIEAIKPIADYQRKLKEVEAEKNKLEQLIKEFEAKNND
jgi:hypothetical protein